MDFKINIGDSPDVIENKLSKINRYIETMKEPLIDTEISCLNTIVRKVHRFLPVETFSGKNGIHIYKFKHNNADREVYISPDVYLIANDCVVYEVFNPKGYSSVSSNPIYKSQTGKYFCEISLKQFMNYVSLEDMLTCMDDILNEDYKEVLEIQKREDFIRGLQKK